MAEKLPVPELAVLCAHEPVVIGSTVSHLDTGEWVASAIVLSGPGGEGPARHVVADGPTRDEAVRALTREIERVAAEPLPRQPDA